MKYIGNRNIKVIKPIKVFTILGYDIFIPDNNNNPISYLKKGCPIWLLYGKDGECDIYECTNEELLYPSLVGIIKKYYPNCKGYYCKPLTDDVIKQLHLEGKGYHELSAICYNEGDIIKAAVLFEGNNKLTIKKGFSCVKIVCVRNNDDEALQSLYEYIFRETNVNKYRGLLVSYKADKRDEIHNAQLLNMVRLEDGEYYYQFE